jgi:hypothetical protein
MTKPMHDQTDGFWQLAKTLCAAVFFQPALMGPPRMPKS